MRSARAIGTGLLLVVALAASGCGAPVRGDLPPAGFDPGIGSYLPHDPRGRSPEFGFFSSDAASGLADELTITYDRPTRGEFCAETVALDFFPTAIGGSGPERLFLAGLKDGQVIVREQALELGDVFVAAAAQTLLATSRLTTITCLRYRPVAGSPGRLLLLDAPQATLWVLDLESASLTLMADGASHPGLVGKRSFFDAQAAGSPDVHYLLFEHFPHETVIAATDRIERLVDVGGDFTIDLFQSMTGAEYVGDDERGASPR